MTASTRRTALGAILAAPLASVPAVAAPPSDLARACHFAVDHWHGITPRCRAEEWDDERLDAEMALYDEIFDRALEESSRTLEDLVAKARLCLHDFEAHAAPCTDPELNRDLDDGQQMVIVVLREVIALCA